jgi:dynein heavy chain, axonemal
MNYDKNTITAATIKKMDEKILNQPEFTFAAVERCSFATKFLYMWCKAMVDYYKVHLLRSSDDSISCKFLFNTLGIYRD